MSRLTGAVAFALATVLLTTAASQEQPTTSSPVRTGSAVTDSRATVPAPAPQAKGVPATSSGAAAVAPPGAAAVELPGGAPVADAVPAGRQSSVVAESGCNGGLVEFGTLISCDAITGAERHVYTLTTTKPGPISYRYVEGRGVRDAVLSALITNAAGQSVCGPSNTSITTCDPGPAGTYTLTVKVYSGSGTGKYSIMVDYAFDPVRPCRTLDEGFHAFGAPGVTGVLDYRTIGDCFTITQPEGSRLLSADGGNGNPAVPMTVWAADHHKICSVGAGQNYPDRICTLAGPGPYFAVVDQFFNEPIAYTLRLPRLSNPVGCAELPVGGFGEQGLQTRDGVADGDLANCHTVTARAGNHLIRVLSAGNPRWVLHDLAGTEICREWKIRTCTLPADGTYTLLVTDLGSAPAAYQAGVTSLDGVTGCAAPVPPGFDVPATRGILASAPQVNCHVIDARPGDRVLTTSTGTGYTGIDHQTRIEIVDGAGTAQCVPAADPCVFTGSGPYRVIATPLTWSAGHWYDVRVSRVNGATGCREVVPGAYGTAGKAADGYCRTLRIPATGFYKTRMFTPYNVYTTGSIYDAAGNVVCALGKLDCYYPAAGTYTAVVTPERYLETEYEWVTVLLSRASAAGCVDVPDQGTSTYRGSFTQVGEYDCLRLPTPEGAAIAAALPDDALMARSHLDGLLVDASGAVQCDLETLRTSSCLPYGPAPFRLLLNWTYQQPADTYAISFIRVDGGANACEPLPSGDPGLTVAATRSRNLGCVTVPAGAHAATEKIQWRRLSNAGDTTVRVFDAAGEQVCQTKTASAFGELSCALPAGAATVVLAPDDRDASYRVSRKPA
ncbi:hypothetical protein [Catenuloplanes japonicus]|uniref:hypothetical protein n=1 Tax=Catenuloplanes japonicus TaxID=33876 RepID=UPI000A75CC3A|nr:hypothetical protein [Catenuloplanes japonicus]